jgi:tetratricopeptide (TPR) repeat protein
MINTYPVRKLLYFFQLLFICSLKSVCQDNPEVNRLLKEADALIATSDLQGALAKAEQALSISANDKKAQQYRINVFYLMQNYKDALKYADEAHDLYPRDPAFLYLRGITLNALGKFSRALNDFSMALAASEDKKDIYKIYLNRAVAYHNLLEFEMAMADFTKSIELNDTVASAYHGRAMLNYEIKDYDAAIKDFNKVIMLGQENDVVFFNLGMSYFRLGEKENACPYFQKSCSMGNKNACRMSLMECVKNIPTIP